jgi:addiction module HigA family antidote
MIPDLVTPPSEFIKETILDEFNLTPNELAKLLGLSEQIINDILTNHAPITANIALRLSKFTKTSPQLWLNLQMNSDLWHELHKSDSVEIDNIVPFTLS